MQVVVTRVKLLKYNNTACMWL